MHDLEFSDSVSPASVRVLKLDLLPYSLGHETLLLRARNAFLLYPSEKFCELPFPQQIFALKTAVLICSQTWAENHRRHKWLRLWGWLTRKANFPLAIAEFQNYIAAGRWLPTPPTKLACEVLYGKDDDKGRSMGSPLLAQLYNWISENPEKFTPNSALRIPHSEFRTRFNPWDVSYTLAGNLYFAHLEMEGRAKIENAAEHEEQAAYDQIKEEIAEEEHAAETSGLATAPPNLD